MNGQAASRAARAGGEFTINAGARSVAICLCVMLTSICSAAPIKAQGRVVGHVLDVEGEWYLDGRLSRALSKGEELPSGGVIRISSASRFAFIIIRYSDNQIISRRCRNQGECDQPILLPRAIQRATSLWDSIAEKAMRVMRRDPVSSSVNAGRSANGLLREAVVHLKDGQIDLAPVFTEMAAGTYSVRVERRTSAGQAAEGESTKPIEIKWDSATATTTPATKLQPGLYEVVLLEKRGAEFKPTLTTAWFLAAGLDQYTQTVGPFCEATRLTATWKDVNEGTIRAFLRAFLIHLASQPDQSTR